MRYLIELSLLLTVLLCGKAQVFPGDGMTVTAYRIEAEVNAGAGAMCDLSDAVIADRIDMTFDSYGDTLVGRTVAMTRDWYELRGDTVWLIGRNTREESFRYLNGAPYLILSGNQDYASVDSVKQQIFYVRESDGTAASMYTSAPGCGFVFNPTDTIAATYCVTTVTADSLCSVRNRRWYAEGCIWPVVEDITLSASDSTLASALYICPPSEQPHPRTAAKGRGNPDRSSSKNRSQNGKSGYDMVYNRLAAADRDNTQPIMAIESTHDFTPTPTGVRLSIDESDGPCTIRLYDAAGRMWRESTGTYISTDNIPPGTYLIEVTTPTTSQTHKIQIR